MKKMYKKTGLSEIFPLIPALPILLTSLLFSAIALPMETKAGMLDTLQPGEWYEVPNSKLSSVLPNPLPPGSPSAIMAAWSGGAFDTKRDRLIIWGGGHNDYGGNEVYAFDINTLSWQRIWGPSSSIPDLYGPCSETYSDGNPVSRHTYEGLEYLPNVDKFFSQGGSLYCGPGSGSIGSWSFDLASLQWEANATIQPLGSWTDLSTVSAYDPISGHVFIASSNLPLWEYDPLANLWSRKSSSSGDSVGGGKSAAIDPTRQKFIVVGNGAVYSFDIGSSGQTPRESLATSGDTAILGKTNPGVVYDPVSDRIVAWSGGADVYILNLDTLVWIKNLPASTNTVIPPAAPSQGTYGRWQYIPSKNAFIGVNRIDENVWIYKLPSGSSSSALPPPQDSIPPIISITTPTNEANVSGSLLVSASASDNMGVIGVQFQLNNTNLGSEDLTSPYSFSVDTATLTDGPYTLTAIARDAAGNTTTSSAISINVSNQSSQSTPPPPPTGQINIPTNTWVTVPAPTVGNGPCPNGVCKHMRLALNPINKRIYFLGGDWTAPEANTVNGNMKMYSYSISDNTWQLEQEYCRADKGLQPGGPDEVGWTYDTKRGVFWSIPGFGFSDAAPRCPGGNVAGPKVLTFDPTTRTWADPGAPLAETVTSVYHEYNKFAHYDPVTDKIYQMVGNNGADVLIFDPTSNTWEEHKFWSSSQFPNARMGQEYSAFDPVDRVIYGISPREPAILRFDIDSQTMSALPTPPAPPAGTDSNMIFWNSVERVLMWIRTNDTDGLVTHISIYDPMTQQWTVQPVTIPANVQNVVGNAGIYDPNQNVLLITGSRNTENKIAEPFLFLYRYAKSGGQTTDTSPPAAPSNLTVN